MAVLKAPLFSFGASGKLADSLVFLPWKGLNNVRKYVIPTNPNSPAQRIQRFTNFKAGVDMWHSYSCTPLDLAAWSLLASTCISKVHASYVGVMSGFNAFMRCFVDAKVADAALIWNELSKVTTPSIGKTVVDVLMSKGLKDDVPKLYYGTTKSYMPKVQTMHISSADDGILFAITGLTASTKYYFTINSTAGKCAARTGIYTVMTLAK